MFTKKLNNLIFKILKIKYINNNNNKIDNIIKNNKIQKYNLNNSNFNNIYNYNNNKLLNNYYLDMNINNLFNTLFYQKLIVNNKLIKLNINISNIYYYHSLNKLNILLFIYVPFSIINKSVKLINKNNLLISRIINRLINNELNNPNINNLLKTISNKDIIIEPIYIKYSYMDSLILSKTLQQQINVIHKFKGKYAQTINNRIPLININNIIQYNYKINKIFNWFINYNVQLSNNINSFNYIFNGFNINNNILPFMLYKHIIGYNWEYKGKIQQSESNARSLKHREQFGIFNSDDHILYNKTFSLLHKSSGLTSNSNWNTNKNGIFNIKVTLSHI